MKSSENGALSELEAQSDPVLAAIGALHNALRVHADAVREVEGCFYPPRQAATRAMIAWDLYRLQDLEAAEVVSLAALHDSERAVLTAHPCPLEGSIAILSFLQSYLSDDPDLGLAIQGIAHVEAVLIASS